MLGFGEGDLGPFGQLPRTRCSRQRTRHPGLYGFGTISTDFYKRDVTGVGVEGPAVRTLLRDCPSHLCDQVSGVPSKKDTGAGLAPVGSSVTVEPGTRALWPVGLSPAERSSGSLRIWGSRGLMRRRHSRLGLLTPGSRL